MENKLDEETEKELVRIAYQYQSYTEEEGLTVRYLLSIIKSLKEIINGKVQA